MEQLEPKENQSPETEQETWAGVPEPAGMSLDQQEPPPELPPDEPPCPCPCPCPCDEE